MGPELDSAEIDMEEIDSEKFSSSSTSSSNVIWFEFLLNPTLLEDHLINENTEPSATDLIVQFLANSSLLKDREQSTFPPITIMPSEKPDPDKKEDTKEGRPPDRKKETALKLLALKIAAFLKWDLNVLQTKLPLTMQNNLLSYLLYVCLNGDASLCHPKLHLEYLEEEIDAIKDEIYFSIVLFHRWCARTVLADSVIVKPSKQPPVPFLGMQDITLNSQPVIENILRNIHDWVKDSKLILEKCLTRRKDVVIPSYQTFETLSEEKTTTNYFWEKGTVIENSEIICQISYDLGCLYFNQHNYIKAGDLLFKTYELYDKMANPKFCCIDYDILKGYCTALGGLLKKTVMSAIPSLTERLQVCVSNNYENVIPILLEDNVVCEISLAYREQIATDLSIQTQYKNNLELQFQICTLNVIRWIMAGHAVAHNYIPILICNGDNGAKFLLKASENVSSYLNAEQSRNLNNFLKYICKATSSVKPSISHILNHHVEDSDVYQSTVVFPTRDFFGHSDLQLGDLELRLFSSFDVQEIWELIPLLHQQGLRKPAWLTTSRWELSNVIQSHVVELPLYVQEATYILIAKVRELINLKCFNEARHILEAVEREVGDKSFKFLRLVLWETLLLDLRNIRLTSLQLPSENWLQELIKQTKSCLSVALQENSMDSLPRSEIVDECAIFLLNHQQWDHFGTLKVEHGNCLEFPVLLSRVCSDVKPNKNSLRELWDIILPIFSNKNGKNKHGTSVERISVLVSRDAPQMIIRRTAFHRFFEKIKNVIVLSIMISYLVRIHNILKDDENNSIPLENLSSALPSVISNSSGFSIKLVQESLMFLLKHALTQYPTSISWLKTLAGLNYAMGNHADALKHYLEVAMLSSDYFSVTIPSYIFDEMSLRRIIRCCTQLQCHTQAAVFCQFLDVVDYTTAFKCLQEKLGMDGIDCYYSCIWDLTILEFLVYIHNKRGEIAKKELALQLIGQLELNANNNNEIQMEAASLRKNRFLRAMVRQYL